MDTVLDRFLKLGQIVALIVVPIWLLSELTNANKILSLRMENLTREMSERFADVAKLQDATAKALAGLDEREDRHDKELAILEGIRIGKEEKEREKRK